MLCVFLFIHKLKVVVEAQGFREDEVPGYSVQNYYTEQVSITGLLFLNKKKIQDFSITSSSFVIYELEGIIVEFS